MKNAIYSALLLFGAVILFSLGGFLVFAENCNEITGEVLRLHIPANSDSAEDQAVKILLRDYLLGEFSESFDDCESLPEADKTAQKLLPEIERKANDFLKSRGFSYGAKASLETARFPTREYDDFILPAGEYRALRVTLGSGAGKNFWCVIFPQLCLPAASKPDSDILKNFKKTDGITVKFALFEWIESLFAS